MARDRRSRCLEWLTGLVSGRIGGNVNLDGCLILQMLEDLGLPLSYASVDFEQPAASMGWGWQMPFYQRIEELDGGDTLLWSDGAGSFEKWRREAGGYVPAFPNNYIQAVRWEEGTCELTFPDQAVSRFDIQANGGRLLSQVDRNGNTVRYEYEPGPDGRLARVVDAWGRSLAYVHRDDGQPGSIEDHRGGVSITRFEYYAGGSTNGRLRAVVSPGGERVEFIYDSNGRLHQVKRAREGYPEGVIDLQVTYYADGRVQTEDFHVVPGQETGQRRNTYSYDFAARQTTVVARDYTAQLPEERTVVATYDQNYQLTSLRDPKGNLTSFEHGDPRNPYLVTRVVDPILAVTEYEYNAQGNRILVRDALQNVTTVRFAEDLFGATTPSMHRNLPFEVHRPPVTVLEQGVEVRRQFPPVRFSYDDRGNLEALVDPRGSAVHFERGADGQVTAVTDRLGHTTAFAYNERGNLQSVTTPGTPGEALPLTTRFEYHPEHFDRLLRTVDPGGNTQGFEFDADERLVKRTDPRGQALRMSYRDGQLGSMLAPPNHGSANQERLTEYRYDLAGRLEEILADVDRFQEGQQRVRYRYDGFDQLRALSRTMNGVPKTTRYDYDALGRPTDNTDPLGRVSHTAYAPYCKEYTHTSARGVANTFHFDPLCRPAESRNSEGGTTFRHDEWGRLVQVTQPGGTAAFYGRGRRGQARYGDGQDRPETRTYEYDELDRLVQATFPDGKSIRYAHDGEGNLIAVTDVHGRTTEYTYLADNRLGTVAQEGQVFRYEYGPDGRLKTLPYPSSTEVRAAYTWDAAGNLEMLHYKRGGVTLHKMEYLYDPSGNRSHFIDTPLDQSQRAVFEYRYDRLNRLTAVYKDQHLVSAYGFDESDNRAWMDKWLDGALRHHEYHYDAADQILDVQREGQSLFAFQHDADGNMLEKKEFDPTTALLKRTDGYTWNPTGRLTTIQVEQTGQSPQTTKNQYDAGQIRKRRIGPDGARTDYYYSGLPALSESTTAGADTSQVSYLVGHQVLGHGSGERSDWFITDTLGSVREIINMGGEILGRYAYDEFGSAAQVQGIPSLQNSQYVGGYGVRADEATTLHYMRHRWYDNQAGRFLSADPVLSANLYIYAGQNPTGRVDPNGTDWRDTARDAIRWFFGADITPLYGPNSTQARDFRDSPGINALRNAYYLKGGSVTNFGVPFKPWRYYGPHNAENFTQQYVGGFDCEMLNNHNGRVTINVYDRKTANSLFLHILGDFGDWEAGYLGSGLMRSQSQQYTWTEPVPTSYVLVPSEPIDQVVDQLRDTGSRIWREIQNPSGDPDKSTIPFPW